MVARMRAAVVELVRNSQSLDTFERTSSNPVEIKLRMRRTMQFQSIHLKKMNISFALLPVGWL